MSSCQMYVKEWVARLQVYVAVLISDIYETVGSSCYTYAYTYKHI